MLSREDLYEVKKQIEKQLKKIDKGQAKKQKDESKCVLFVALGTAAIVIGGVIVALLHIKKQKKVKEVAAVVDNDLEECAYCGCGEVEVELEETEATHEAETTEAVEEVEVVQEAEEIEVVEAEEAEATEKVEEVNVQ